MCPYLYYRTTINKAQTKNMSFISLKKKIDFIILLGIHAFDNVKNEHFLVYFWLDYAMSSHSTHSVIIVTQGTLNQSINRSVLICNLPTAGKSV